MKIGIVHRANVADVRTLSGVPYFMARALQEHVGEVLYLGPDDSLLTNSIESAGRVINRVSYATFGRRISTDHHRVLSKRFAHKLGRYLLNCDCDVLFAPVASVEIAYLSTDLPVIYYSDATWDNIVDYYLGCSSLFQFARKEADWIEAAALGTAAALIVPSTWAASSAVGHYNVDPQKVHLIPCGANFERAEIPPREAAMKHSQDKGIVLLWIGVDWERKGGSIAHDCLIELLNRGLDARLVVCGCIPPHRYHHQKMEIIPFLNKRNAVERERLSQLFLEANFFLFPTIAEAFGIVLCEASAHGLPSLVRNTGGVGGAVTDGENGYLMPPDAKGKEYAERILWILKDTSAYDELVKTSRTAYEERLNWDAWGRLVRPIFEQVAGKKGSRCKA